MKFDLNRKLINAKGEPMKDGGREVTMAEPVSQMMFAASQGGTDEKMKCFDIWMRIRQNPSEVELSSEDVVLIKKVIGESMVAGALGQIVYVLENKC